MPNETETVSEETLATESTTEDTSQTSTEESLIGGEVKEEAPKDESLIGGKVEDEESGPEFGLDSLDAENIEIPEAIELSEDQTSEFTDLVNNAESKVDLANKMLAMYAGVAKDADEAGAKVFTEMNETWIKEIETDTELGGNQQEESLAVAKGLMDRYGSSPFNKLLHLTGMGNNIEFLRFLHKVNADLPQQATPATGNPASGSRSLADRLFNND